MMSDEELTRITLVKICLAGQGDKIRLYDIVSREVKSVIGRLNAMSSSQEGVVQQIQACEQIVAQLERTMILLGYWGDHTWRPITRLASTRLAESIAAEGSGLWAELCSYPELLIIYATGISLVAAGNYASLADLFLSEVYSARYRTVMPLVLSVYDDQMTLARSELFKRIPEYNNRYIPLHEYLFDKLRPDFDELLFWGDEYESFFDRFEALLALVCADLYAKKYERFLGPVGRWRYHGDRYGNPLQLLMQEAKKVHHQWPPLQAGLFDGSPERFEAVHNGFCQAAFR